MRQRVSIAPWLRDMVGHYSGLYLYDEPNSNVFCMWWTNGYKEFTTPSQNSWNTCMKRMHTYIEARESKSECQCSSQCTYYIPESYRLLVYQVLGLGDIWEYN